MGTGGSTTRSEDGTSSSSGEPVDTDDEPADTDGEPSPGLMGVVVPHRPGPDQLEPVVLDWIRIDTENVEPIRLSAPEHLVAGTGFAWGDWYAFAARADENAGRSSLYLNSLSAPVESAPTLYFDHFDSLDTHPNGTMVIALRIGEMAPFRYEVRVASAPPLGSPAESPPESTLLFEFDGRVSRLEFSPSGDFFYFRSGESWYAASIDGGAPVHLLDNPCQQGRVGGDGVLVAFQPEGLVYACEATTDGSAVAGIVDPESAVVTDLVEDDPGTIPLSPFLNEGLALWHFLNLEDSHRYFVTLISGETTVIETDELSFSHVSLSPDRRWVSLLGGSSEPPLEVHSLGSESVVAEFPELSPSRVWHPTEPMLFAKRKARFGPGISRLSLRDNEVVELDTISAGLPPDTLDIVDFELVPGTEVAMVTVLTSRGGTLGRVDLAEAVPTFIPLHDDSFEVGFSWAVEGHKSPFPDGLSVLSAGPDADSGLGTLYLLQLGREPQLLLETGGIASPGVAVMIP